MVGLLQPLDDRMPVLLVRGPSSDWRVSSAEGKTDCEPAQGVAGSGASRAAAHCLRPQMRLLLGAAVWGGVADQTVRLTTSVPAAWWTSVHDQMNHWHWLPHCVCSTF